MVGGDGGWWRVVGGGRGWRMVMEGGRGVVEGGWG